MANDVEKVDQTDKEMKKMLYKARNFIPVLVYFNTKVTYILCLYSFIFFNNFCMILKQSDHVYTLQHFILENIILKEKAVTDNLETSYILYVTLRLQCCLMVFSQNLCFDKLWCHNFNEDIENFIEKWQQ